MYRYRNDYDRFVVKFLNENQSLNIRNAEVQDRTSTKLGSTTLEGGATPAIGSSLFPSMTSDTQTGALLAQKIEAALGTDSVGLISKRRRSDDYVVEVDFKGTDLGEKLTVNGYWYERTTGICSLTVNEWTQSGGVPLSEDDYEINRKGPYSYGDEIRLHYNGDDFVAWITGPAHIETYNPDIDFRITGTNQVAALKTSSGHLVVFLHSADTIKFVCERDDLSELPVVYDNFGNLTSWNKTVEQIRASEDRIIFVYRVYSSPAAVNIKVNYVDKTGRTIKQADTFTTQCDSNTNLSLPEVIDGKEFCYLMNNEKIFSTRANACLHPLQDMEFTAVYGEKGDESDLVIANLFDIFITPHDGKKDFRLAPCFCASESVVVEAGGLILANEAMMKGLPPEEALLIENSSNHAIMPNKYATANGAFASGIKNIPDGAVMYACAYLTVSRNGTDFFTVYSDIVALR